MADYQKEVGLTGLGWIKGTEKGYHLGVKGGGNWREKPRYAKGLVLTYPQGSSEQPGSLNRN